MELRPPRDETYIENLAGIFGVIAAMDPMERARLRGRPVAVTAAQRAAREHRKLKRKMAKASRRANRRHG